MRFRAWAKNVMRAMAGGGVSAVPPHDDFWYNRPGYATDAGVNVSPESALRLAAVFACVRVCAETIASLPLIVYKRLPNGGKIRATNHPLYKVLHDRPNPWQTSFDFVEMMQGHLELRGNAFSRIIPGPKGAIDQLIPIHPDRVNVFRLDNGRLRYEVARQFGGAIDKFTQEEIFHVPGFSQDGILGMSTIAAGREVVGGALGAQEYANRFFANDSRPSGVLETAGTLSQEASKRVRDSWQEANSGINRHRVAVLEEGLQYKQMGLTNRDSQFIEARQFSRADIASLFRIPLHKIGDLTKATFSNIEQQAIEFVVDSIRPRVVRWERRINCDLIDPLDLGDEYFAEFLMDALLRGDLKSRYDAYSVGRQNGWLSTNDIRGFENMNPVEGGDDDYLVPLNMQQKNKPAAAPADERAEQEDFNAKNGRIREFALAAAERVVRKEVTALRKAYARSNGNLETFRADVAKFYSEFAKFVEEAAHISHNEAGSYVWKNLQLLTEASDPSGVLGWIEATGAESLASTALGVKE